MLRENPNSGEARQATRQGSIFKLGHRFKLRHQLSHLARRKFAFPVCIVEPWNKLPPEVVDSVYEEIFKRRLDGVWDTLFIP